MNRATPFISLLVVVAIVILSSLANQSPSPIPTAIQSNQKNGDAPKSNAPANQRGTEDAPFVIRIDQTQEQKDDSAKTDEYAKENIRLQTMQTRFNGALAVLAFFTLCFLGFQV